MSELPNPNPGVLVEGDMPTMSDKALPSMPPVPDRKLVPSAALAPTKMRKVSTATGLTAREYHVLRILDATDGVRQKWSGTLRTSTVYLGREKARWFTVCSGGCTNSAWWLAAN